MEPLIQFVHKVTPAIEQLQKRCLGAGRAAKAA